MNRINRYILQAALTMITVTGFAQKINRKVVVARHQVMLNQIDILGSLTVGNGKFAFTVDATGLQSFPEYYAKGVPLGTQSEWGWHTFPNQGKYQFSETLVPYDFNGNPNRLYAVQPKKEGRNLQAVDYFRANPHRLQLGNFGFEIIKKDGKIAEPTDLKEINQVLDPWTGVITSKFKVDGTPVVVITCADSLKDMIAVKVFSALLAEGRMRFKFKFPFPTNQFTDVGINYTNADRHQTNLSQSGSTALFTRKLDLETYSVAVKWNNTAEINKVASHDYVLQPGKANNFEVSVLFSPEKPDFKLPDFNSIEKSSAAGWGKFWQSGAAIDFDGSTDPRAKELERRVVLSQYLTRVQCAGNYPPQETGLTYNSWYGKPHMEMYWWHAAHYALWGRTDLLEKSMRWYFTAFKNAAGIAKRQGYEGVRWQKMTDHESGEAPSSIGSFLIWQQPHPIYLSELVYRNHPSKSVLEKYKKLIFSTADFMASYAHLDPLTGRYNLGKGIIPAQEYFNPLETFNSPYELAYWKWALQVAQKWRSRLGMPPDQKWQKVIDQLAPLAQENGVYKAAESVADSYSPASQYTVDHPAVLAAFSTLPSNGFVDTTVMLKTYNLVDQVWKWDRTWGWDFPLIAMTATRLNQPEKAIDALFKTVKTNTYLVNGHNYQNKLLTLYLPGNGGLLSAIAMMCAGTDDNKHINPGFPKNGKWNVKWEGFKPMP